MNARTKFVSILGLSTALVGAWATVALAGDEKGHTHAKIGEAAPAFTLKDTKGADRKLADFAGKIVVLEWFNPGCPYCVGVYSKGVVADTLKQLKAIDSNIVYLAVNSTAMDMKGPVTAEQVIQQSDEFLKQHNVQIPVLIDHDGAVGHSYDARTTPHMFVIDDKGVLRYHGAFTDDPKGEKKDATNYVVNAVKQIKSGETVSPDNTKSWGCSVKYARKAGAEGAEAGEGKGRGH